MNLQYTSINSIPETVQTLRTSYLSRDLDSVNVRIHILKLIHDSIAKNIKPLQDALAKDFNRSPFETVSQEIFPVLAEIQYIIANLKSWVSPKRQSGGPFLVYSASSTYLEHIALGTVLVISAFNYPILLSISPVVGALAAGNTVVLKPSELTPHTSSLLTFLLTSCIPSQYLQVVNGGIPETTALLQEKFDKILFTGSAKVGKIVSLAAAHHLTPVVMELGGKSPAFLSKSLSESQLRIAVKRILWAKFTNSGQICLAVDYLLVDKSIHHKIKSLIIEVCDELFPNPTPNSNFTHIATEASYERLVGLLSKTKSDLVMGAVTDETVHFISPTVFDNVQWDDVLMEEEIFGPILPIVPIDNVNVAVEKIIKYHDTPLASYIYSNDANEIEKYKQVRSGAVIINDAVMHCVNSKAPFGGIGTSGHGSYHGYYSFKTFTHERLVMKQYWITEALLGARYPSSSSMNETLLRYLFLPFGVNDGIPAWQIAGGLLLMVLTMVYKLAF